LSGIDASGTSRHTIVATGIIYAFVAAFSMAVGSFLSEQSAEEYTAQGLTTNSKAIESAVTMFVSFVLASFIPLVPYLFTAGTFAFTLSIVFAVASLFIVGLISAKISKVPIIKRALTMACLGGAAIAIGVLVGKFVRFV
jgi:VIT1/CCC1 family predicted Fe2+/Mn2+ transporter